MRHTFSTLQRGFPRNRSIYWRLKALRSLQRQRPFHGSLRTLEERKSFRDQLISSTQQRIERERIEQERFRQSRSENSGGGTVARTLFLVATAGICYYLGRLVPFPPSAESTLELNSTKPPEHDLRPANLQAAWTELVGIVGLDWVSTDERDLRAHASSEWSSYSTKPQEKPFLVVFPLTTEDISKITKVCHQRKIPMTAYAGGTSLEGHFVPTRGGICIDFQRMGNILKLSKEDMDVVVQPAVQWQDLDEELSEHGLFFPPDPGPGAMIGGMVGTGCSGTNAYRYGTMKEWVLALTVVLADGTIIKTRQRPRKSSAGYDLTRLFIGSEGTLGLVTEATLKLTNRPKSSSVAVASFPSIRDAASCVGKVVDDGVPIAAVEILDDVQMHCINESHGTARQWEEAPTLFFKFAGTSAGVKEQVGIVQKLAKLSSCRTFEFAKNDEEAGELWSARKEALWSVMAKRRENDHVWTTDVAVPISRLPDIIEETKEDLASSGLLGTIVGHVGDGNFHTILLFNENEREVAEGIVHRMVKRAVDMEGTVSGEHGVGLVKRDYLEHELGQPAVNTMRKLKLALDPLCLLNCDKVVRFQAAQSGEVKPW